MKKPKETVAEYMVRLEHPLKAEIEILRTIIKAVSPKIGEEIKWNAPSYSYKDYIATFNLRTPEYIHLIFHNPAIASIQNPILEGDYVDRRMVYFYNMDEIEAKKADLESVIGTLVQLMDA